MAGRIDDPRELLELHLQEQDELTTRAALIDCLVDVLGSDEPAERDCYRWELSQLRKIERKAQRVNGTMLVLDSPTFDLNAGDEPAEVTDYDLDRLAYHGISVPDSDCVIVETLDVDVYAQRAFWEGF